MLLLSQLLIFLSLKESSSAFQVSFPLLSGGMTGSQWIFSQHSLCLRGTFILTMIELDLNILNDKKLNLYSDLNL